MAEVSIPSDRDILSALALKILKENSKLSKEFGVTVPKRNLKQLRPARKAARTLKRVKALRDRANALAKTVDLGAIEEAVRDIAQILLRQTDVETVKHWGYSFTAGPRKGPEKA